MSDRTAGKVAKLNVVVSALLEWQRHAITWAEAMRRADLTTAEEKGLADVSRGNGMGEDRLAAIVARAIGL